MRPHFHCFHWARLAFWATGLSIFVLWNLGTLIGATATHLIADPNRYGLDVAFPAVFLALIWPQIRDRSTIVIAPSPSWIADNLRGSAQYAPRGCSNTLLGLSTIIARIWSSVTPRALSAGTTSLVMCR